MRATAIVTGSSSHGDAVRVVMSSARLRSYSERAGNCSASSRSKAMHVQIPHVGWPDQTRVCAIRTRTAQRLNHRRWTRKERRPGELTGLPLEHGLGRANGDRVSACQDVVELVTTPQGSPTLLAVYPCRALAAWRVRCEPMDVGHLELYELVPKLSVRCRSWVEGSAVDEQ